MLRVFIGALGRTTSACLQRNVKNLTNNLPIIKAVQQRNYTSSLLSRWKLCDHNVSLIAHPKIAQIANNIQTRSVTKFSWGKGKRKSVKAVLERFYRLNWGIWIRTKAGRQKKLWKKRSSRKRRLRQHVFCNAQQSYLLDKMVGKYWRKPKYYVDDPYEPYHKREEFMYTRITPRPYIPKEEI